MSYTELLGRSVNDPLIVRYSTENGCELYGSQRQCRLAGTILFYRDSGRIHQVKMYGPGIGGTRAYQGDLPRGLQWSDSHAAVVAKLGQPVKVVQATTSTLPWADFGSGRTLLIVTYNREGSVIHDVQAGERA
ncbi:MULTISPECIES: hypothetical protein [unclassified Frankia]|uniref:hypothetical protein n=1 Tax=unclassified Frankia TaxID=2632575 RepID=UPI002024E54D